MSFNISTNITPRRGSTVPNYAVPFEKKNFVATVTEILLSEDQRQEFFKDAGPKIDPSLYGLGTIKFQVTNPDTYTDNTYEYAIPKTLHNTLYPRQYEMVTVEAVQTFEAQDSKASSYNRFVYSDVISAQSNIEQNSVPKNTITGNTKVAPGLTTYKEAQIGIGANSIQTDSYKIKELGNIKNPYPGEGHNILSGRFGNYMRFGASHTNSPFPWEGPDFAPVTIIRNGQKAIPEDYSSDHIEESPNEDGSSFYMLSKQKIKNFKIACNNFKSFNLKIEESPKSNIVLPTAPKVDNAVPNDAVNPTPAKDPLPQSVPLSAPPNPITASYQDDLAKMPEYEDQLTDVAVDESLVVPVTNGIYGSLSALSKNLKYTYSVGNNSSTKYGNGYLADTKAGSSVYTSNSGKITESSLGVHIKALLDLISYMEGTIGAGEFNGYDVCYAFKKLKGFDSYNSNPPHPNIAITANGYTSTAAGRYQFLYDAWVDTMGASTGMSKNNQDTACYKRMLKNVSQASLDKLKGMDPYKNDRNYFADFQLIIGGKNINGSEGKGDPNCLAGIWASLPSTYGGVTGYYGQNTSNPKSFETLYDIYKDILKIYSYKAPNFINF